MPDGGFNIGQRVRRVHDKKLTGTIQSRESDSFGGPTYTVEWDEGRKETGLSPTELVVIDERED